MRSCQFTLAKFVSKDVMLFLYCLLSTNLKKNPLPLQEIFRKSVRHQKELFLPLLKMRVEAKRMQSISRQKVCRPSPNLQNSPCSPISEQIWLDLVCLRAFWPFVKGNWVRLPYSPWELNSRTSQEASVTKLFYQGNGIVLAKLWMCKFVLTSNLKNEIENALWFVWFFF